VLMLLGVCGMQATRQRLLVAVLGVLLRCAGGKRGLGVDWVAGGHK
jgi:hypothetical protein